MTLAIPVGMELVTAIGSLADKRHRLPDITTFVVHPDYLNRPYLYPRQATLLKVIFLDLEHMTEYDHRVIAEWEADYIASMDKDGVGNNGIVPGILERVRINRICPCGHDRGSHFVQGTTALDKVGTRCDECTDCHRYRGRRWFREVVSVIGRRGSKGHVGALATAYIIAHFIEMGNPQERYGIDRDKRLSAIVFAGKKEQAKANQWRDIVNVILGAPYFTPYISKPQAESLTIRSQSDLLSLREREGRGVHSEQDIATFEILPKESTTIAGRGQAGFLLIFDEAAHVVKGVANSPAEDVYDSSSPSLDQFGLDGFIYIPSSPWQKIGLLFDRYNLALEVEEDGSPVYPEMMMIQLTSWDIYKDWERSHEIPMVANRPTPFLHLKGAVQAYDEQMERLERANPETFRVERRCLDPDTRVLTADLDWVPIKDLLPGDKIIGFDEKPQDGKARRLRTASVVAKMSSWDKAYQLTFEDGSSVVCSGNHRWLSSSGTRGGKYGNRGFRWRSLYADPHVPGPRQSLKEGDLIRFLVEPWEKDESWGAGYLAGVYDGEGSVWAKERSGSWLSFPQHRVKNGDVLDLTLSLLKERGFDPVMGIDKGGVEHWRINGFDQVARFVGMIGGAKMRRQAIPKLWEGRGLPKMDGFAGVKKIVKIEELPEQELIDIETTTGTFIAEGLISHNSQFAAVLDAYLNPDRIAEIWQEDLPMLSKGTMTVSYRAHADPSTSGAAFAFAIGHRVDPDPKDTDALPMVVFDLIHSWKPEDYDDHQVPYLDITEELKGYLDGFMPAAMTFDQYNATGFIQALKQHVRHRRYPKRVQVYERPATHDLNWKTYETFKTAVGLGLVKAPFHEDANAELTFLQLVGNKRVDHPDAGPVQRKDIADCMAIITYELIGDSIAGFVGKTMGELSVLGAMQGGVDAAGRFAEDAHERMSQFGRTRSSRIKRG